VRASESDVIIIGGGVAGTSIARELSKYQIDVVLLEKEKELCFGITKATHSFIHCGLPETGNPLRNKLVLEGNRMFDQLAKELDVPFSRIGKMLTVMQEEDSNVLGKIVREAKRAGVPGVKILKRNEIKAMEPNITEKVKTAVYTPTTALVSPWELIFALAENAQNNGINIIFNTEVKTIKITDGNIFNLITDKGWFKCKFLINAAGLFADEIAAMVGAGSFKMVPIKQERYILDEKLSNMVNHLVRSPLSGDFVSPTKKELGKENNNIILGYTVQKVDDKDDTTTSSEGFKRVFSFAKKIFPFISTKDLIVSFAGLIPLNTRTTDYVIESDEKIPTLINAVLGASGVSASPAVAKMIVKKLHQQGLKLIYKSKFKAKRRAIIEFKNLSQKEKKNIISKDKRYGHVVCRCETVTEGEIVEAIRRGARTLDGIKYRTRAGMGRCQGGFCSPRVIKILARELNLPETQVTKKGDDSRILLFESKQLLKKKPTGG